MHPYIRDLLSIKLRDAIDRLHELEHFIAQAEKEVIKNKHLLEEQIGLVKGLQDALGITIQR